MENEPRRLQRRVESLRIRVETLSSLRPLVGLPPRNDITKRQWAVIESQLKVVEARLLSRIKQAAREHLPNAHDLQATRSLNVVLGDVELELSRAFAFFDTYMDVLTQRHTPELGPLLAGCDVLAWDAINKDHPALAIIEPPLVYCDRGFGASTIREGVLLSDRTPNPMPLIQIPYTRLKEKYNLTSILHEVGHEVMVRLGLVSSLPRAFGHALTGVGAPQTIQELFALWTKEIGPDFWTFCAAGVAAAAGIKDILALPPNHTFRISWIDPHPPPYLRVLLTFEWCRQVWGRGDWDIWEKEWRELYRLEDAPFETQRVVKQAQSYLPIISRTLLQTKFSVLNGRAIPELFDLSTLAPAELRKTAMTARAGVLNLKGLSPSAQLAVFRLVRDNGHLKEEAVDKLMTQWLLKLGEQRLTTS